MSGPALRQYAAHHSIHDAAFQEAEELTSLLAEQTRHPNLQTFTDLAYVLLEHWETRTLRHAEMEEQEFYQEVQANFPQLQETVLRLSRDHDLLRCLAREIRTLLTEPGSRESTDEAHFAVLARFQTMLHLNRIHSREEEALLVQPVEQAQERLRTQHEIAESVQHQPV